MKHAVFAALMATALLTGCSLAPNYSRPDLPIPPAWPVGAAYQAVPPPNAHGANPVASAETIGWREFFTDPRLRALIEISLRNNRDLRIATLNVAGAEARYRVQRANLFPLLTATGADSIQRTPDNGSGSAAPPGPGRSTPASPLTNSICLAVYAIFRGRRSNSIWAMPKVGVAPRSASWPKWRTRI